jgi:hypothetical protein
VITDNGLRVTGTLVAVGPSPAGLPYWAVWVETRAGHTVLVATRDEATARAAIGEARIGQTLTIELYAYPLSRGYLLFPDDHSQTAR